MTAFYSKIFCNGSPKVAFSFHFQCYSIMLNLLRCTNVCGAKFGLKDLLCVKKMTFRNSGENKLTVTIMILYNDCPISIAYMWSLMLPWSWSSKGYRLVWNSKGGGNWSSEPERLHTGKGRHPTKKNYLKRALPVKLRSIDYQIDRVGYSCTALHSSVCPSRWLQPPPRRTQRTSS